jgi:chromosome segregation ATPase
MAIDLRSDVFMDNVNRDVSMRMMIHAARRAEGRQFILITPQSMGNIQLGTDVKIHKYAQIWKRVRSC